MRGWLVVALACCCAPQLARAAEPSSGVESSGSGARSGPRVFDLAAAQHFAGLGVARSLARRTDGERYRAGYELRAVDVLRWTRGMAVVEGWFGAGVRWGPSHLSGSILQNGGMAGLALGPLDVKGGVSTSLLSLGVSSGDFSVGLFWPRASLGLGLALGSVRIDALAHVEYAWDWLGPDRYMRGLGLVLSLLRAPVGPDYQRPPEREP